MKKIVLFCAGVLLLASLPAFAQEQSSEYPKDGFAKSVPIIKIYAHELGYKILYLKSNQQLGEMYVPLKWFTRAASKGVIVWGASRAYPYFSMYWVDGKFDHIVLYLLANMESPSWGVLRTSEDLSSNFNIEEPQFQF